MVRALCLPSASVMDVTIGAALWCGARAEGKLASTEEAYKSVARVLLAGGYFFFLLEKITFLSHTHKPIVILLFIF